MSEIRRPFGSPPVPHLSTNDRDADREDDIRCPDASSVAVAFLTYDKWLGFWKKVLNRSFSKDTYI